MSFPEGLVRSSEETWERGGLDPMMGNPNLSAKEDGQNARVLKVFLRVNLQTSCICVAGVRANHLPKAPSPQVWPLQLLFGRGPCQGSLWGGCALETYPNLEKPY